MRYELVGVKIPYVGKTLWEIVGNLKNFGVGRIIKKTYPRDDSDLNFIKVLKVQPLPPPKSQFKNRPVIVYVDEIYQGRRLPTVYIKEKESAIPKYQLIPKFEEEKYLKVLENLVIPDKHVNKYCVWPPLYKKLWLKNNPNHKEVPKMSTVIEDDPSFNIIKTEDELQQVRTSLYKGELSVHEMYLEIVRLKKLIKAKEASQ